MRKERARVCVCACVCWVGVGDVCYRGDRKMLRKKFQKRGGQKQHSPKTVQQGRKQATCVTRGTREEGACEEQGRLPGLRGGPEGRPATVSGLVPSPMTFLLTPLLTKQVDLGGSWQDAGLHSPLSPGKNAPGARGKCNW